MMGHLCNHPMRKVFFVLACIAITAGCTGVEIQSNPTAVPEIRPGILAGYLDRDVLPSSLALVPPPPADGSIALARDEAFSQQSLALRGTPRWTLAAEDAELMFPTASEAFSCAMNVPISETQTPHLYMLLRRTLADAGLSTYMAKSHYQRKRPFMVNGQPTCRPDHETHLIKNGSYPSGHTAIGWAWALILSEIAPHRADAILARGRSYGESRIVCNVHWLSDVIEGRFMGAAVVARLHADSGFLHDLDQAKKELAGILAAGLEPIRDCQAEADALAQPLIPVDGEISILQSWQGDYPVAQLSLLPENQGDQAVGFITDADIFEAVWNAFMPKEALPDIDFNDNLVIFTRNTQFYNRITIGRVKVTGGVAEVLAMETMSAAPIEGNVAMSMVVVPHKGIAAIHGTDKIIPVKQVP